MRPNLNTLNWNVAPNLEPFCRKSPFKVFQIKRKFKFVVFQLGRMDCILSMNDSLVEANQTFSNVSHEEKKYFAHNQTKGLKLK